MRNHTDIHYDNPVILEGSEIISELSEKKGIDIILSLLYVHLKFVFIPFLKAGEPSMYVTFVK